MQTQPVQCAMETENNDADRKRMDNVGILRDYGSQGIFEKCPAMSSAGWKVQTKVYYRKMSLLCKRNGDMADYIVKGKNVRLGRNVVVTGTVRLGADTSVWHNVVLRGDVAPISIGAQCNIQDGTVIHGQLNQWNVTMGDKVSVGHSCILHGCELESECFIGMGSMIMNGCRIGRNVLIAAGSLIPEGTKIVEENVLVMGRPGKIVRELNEREIAMIRDTPGRYIEYADRWLPLTGN